jgi:hypothetical protein
MPGYRLAPRHVVTQSFCREQLRGAFRAGTSIAEHPITRIE